MAVASIWESGETAPPAQAACASRRSISGRGRARLANRLFFVSALVISLALPVSASWPALEDALVGEPVPAAERYGVPPLIDAFQGRYFRVCGLAGSGTVILYMACLGYRRHLLLRTVALGAVLSWYALNCLVHDRLYYGERALGLLAAGDTFEMQWQNLERLRIVECPPVHQHLGAFAARDEFRARKLRTFAEVHRAVMKRFDRDKEWLSKRWRLTDPADELKLKTLFTMNFVAGMWNFGNCHEVDHMGCVGCNERQNKRRTNLERANSHAVAGGGGIGGGTPAEIRFRHVARCRIRKINQPTNANKPPGRLTSINQPITPSE